MVYFIEDGPKLPLKSIQEGLNQRSIGVSYHIGKNLDDIGVYHNGKLLFLNAILIYGTWKIFPFLAKNVVQIIADTAADEPCIAGPMNQLSVSPTLTRYYPDHEGTYIFCFRCCGLFFFHFIHFLLILILFRVSVFGVYFLAQVTGCTTQDTESKGVNRFTHSLALITQLLISHLLISHLSHLLTSLILDTLQMSEDRVLTSAGVSSAGVSSGATSGAASASACKESVR